MRTFARGARRDAYDSGVYVDVDSKAGCEGKMAARRPVRIAKKRRACCGGSLEPNHLKSSIFDLSAHLVHPVKNGFLKWDLIRRHTICKLIS